MSSGVAVEVDEITKSWTSWGRAAHHALRGLSLRIPTGTAFGLIGPNGAGKTTFIKLLIGVARATSGTVRVLDGDPDDTAIRQRIGYLPERLHLPAALRGRDVLRSIATLKNMSPSAAELRAALERVGLADSTQRVGTFSKGMKQRLGLATALLGQPDLLVLDEPTDGIDPLGRVEVRSILLEEKKRGTTILLNSHLLSETERVCDRIGILNHGALVLEGSLEAIRATSGKWLVRFAAGSNEEIPTRLGFVRDGAAWTWVGNTADGLNHALHQARMEGLNLIELTPATVDLEAVLAKTLELERSR